MPTELSGDDQALDSPGWHEDALRETERRYILGEEKPIDWETAKKELLSIARQSGSGD